MKILLSLIALPALLLPIAILIYILWQAWPALSWQLLLPSTTSGSTAAFGMNPSLLDQTLGSLLLMLLSTAIATPFALAIALYHAIWASHSKQRLLINLLQLLQGIPPIVYGLCGFIILVQLLQWGISLAAGSVILALIILPLFSSNIIHALEGIPPEFTTSARALGLDYSAIIWRVWLPEAWQGIITGLLLAMARALSETAPILFTATVFSGVHWPDSILNPVTTLQTHIFYLAQEGSNPEAIATAWASAALLLGLILCFSLLARRLHRHTSTDHKEPR